MPMIPQQANTFLKFFTQYYTGVTTAGVEVTFSEPVEFVRIECSGSYYLRGNADDDSAADIPISYLTDPRCLPVGGPADKPLFTVKAQSGTINVSVEGYSNR